MNKKTVLFDFDGVIADTEHQYDVFIDALGDKYESGLPHFSAHIKGKTLPNIIEQYFSHLSPEGKANIEAEMRTFELAMDYRFIPGADLLISRLKENGHRLGLVTSSLNYKMEVALQTMNLHDTFDVMVTGDDIAKGKPDPMCYLLAAEKLGQVPSNCIVIEDSISGVQSGKAAGMKVIAVATTLPEEKLLPLNPDLLVKDFSEPVVVYDFIS